MIFLFNGPPGSGKDVCADYVVAVYGYEKRSFKTTLINETCEHYGVSYDWFMEGYDDRERKEQPCPELGGLSKRQALIHVSEDVKKPEHGVGYFGQKVAETCEPGRNYVLSDSGFVAEAQALVDAGHPVTIIRIYREGCDYSFDSRRYVLVEGEEPRPYPEVYAEGFVRGAASWEIVNDGTLDDLFEEVSTIIETSS